LTTEEVVGAIGGAAWSWNLDQFCEALGWTRDDYAIEKFQAFQTAARYLGQFDADTWDQIVQARRAQTAARRK
jgi:hypothetical protein